VCVFAVAGTSAEPAASIPGRHNILAYGQREIESPVLAFFK